MLFSESETFAAILIAQWTHVFLEGDSWGPKGRWGGGSEPLPAS